MNFQMIGEKNKLSVVMERMIRKTSRPIRPNLRARLANKNANSLICANPAATTHLELLSFGRIKWRTPDATVNFVKTTRVVIGIKMANSDATKLGKTWKPMEAKNRDAKKSLKGSTVNVTFLVVCSPIVPMMVPDMKQPNSIETPKYSVISSMKKTALIIPRTKDSCDPEKFNPLKNLAATYLERTKAMRKIPVNPTTSSKSVKNRASPGPPKAPWTKL